jgi:hypothetical protein
MRFAPSASVSASLGALAFALAPAQVAPSATAPAIARSAAAETRGVANPGP